MRRIARFICGEKSDLIVVGSIAANEAIIAVLQSSVLDDTWVVSLEVVIVLIQTTGAVDTTDRADVRSGSPVNTGCVVDAFDLSGCIETAVAVKPAIDATAA